MVLLCIVMHSYIKICRYNTDNTEYYIIMDKHRNTHTHTHTHTHVYVPVVLVEYRDILVGVENCRG